MKGKALRKHSLHEKTAASVLLKPFISSACFSFNFNSAFKADKMNRNGELKLLNVLPFETNISVFWLKYSAMEGTDRCVYAKNAVPLEAQTGMFTLRM